MRPRSARQLRRREAKHIAAGPFDMNDLGAEFGKLCADIGLRDEAPVPMTRMPSSGPKAGEMHGVGGRSRCLTQSGILCLSSSILASETSRGSCAILRVLPVKVRPPVGPAAVVGTSVSYACIRLPALRAP